MATTQNNISEKTKKEEIMTQVIHYFVLIFIVFVLAEIRNVLLYDIPYQNKSVSLWSETSQNSQPQPDIKFL